LPDGHRTYSRLFLGSAPATTDIYALSLHDALPIYRLRSFHHGDDQLPDPGVHHLPAGPHRQSADCEKEGRRGAERSKRGRTPDRSEEHTSELQSRENLVCRLLLEKKKKRVLDRNA